jgi:molecular chaperone HtpG
MDYAFQVHLGGIIALLSDHLYSQPGIYLRELLQNARDAIAARRQREPGFEGSVLVELSLAPDGVTPSLIVHDDGVGLTEDEVHRFLATIGASSKREALEEHRADFIGQFGIGLLSCFIACDEVLLLTRSMTEGSPTLQWRGRRDGSYELGPAPIGLERPGTRVLLRPRPGAEEAVAADWVRERLLWFGVHLQVPLWLQTAAGRERLDAVPPWRRAWPSESERRAGLLAYGEQAFGEPLVDAIPLRSEAGGVDGVAFVLARSPRYGVRPRHRVYLKGMLLGDDVHNLLPEWAFFVRCVVDASALEPNASREALRDDERLEDARRELGELLKRYWETLARERPEALRRLIELHGLSVRALAVDDDDFFALVADSLQFETSLGEMTLGQCRRLCDPVRYVVSLSDFRQMAPIAAAQGLCLLNAAYTYDAELMERLPDVLDVAAEPFTSADLPHTLVDLTMEERRALLPFLQIATDALEPFDVAVEGKSFSPETMPVLFSASEETLFLRSVARVRDDSDPLFAGLLDDVLERQTEERVVVCFNVRNPVVRRLAAVQDAAIAARLIELLYVQSVMLSHRPLRARELALMNHGLLALIEAHLGAIASVH